MAVDPSPATTMSSARPDEIQAVDPGPIADAVFYSVSHDLRSPLLTMSLSADLITDALNSLPQAAGGPIAIALDALRHGAKDMERMLQALTLLSRARRRELQPSRVALPVVLGGHVVLSEVGDLRDVHVAVDPVPVRDLLDAISGDQPVEVRVRLEGDFVVLECASPAGAAEEGGSPLEMLVGSLHHHAGTPVEQAAAAQVMLERQGAVVRCVADRLVVHLPRAGKR